MGSIAIIVSSGALGAAVMSALLGDDINEALEVGNKYARGATAGASLLAPFGLGPVGLVAGAILGGTAAILHEDEEDDPPLSRSLVPFGAAR